jgi:tRNA(fMet)-specific endonuclease VapC
MGCPKTNRLWRTTTFRSTDPVFCLDTNVVIFAINERRPKIVERLHRELAAGTPMLVPATVMFEPEYRCAESKRREHSRRALEIFLSAGFDQPLFDVEDAREAGEIRAVLEASGQPIGPYHTFIAAQARRRRATLATLNARGFERVPGLTVEDWAA